MTEPGTPAQAAYGRSRAPAAVQPDGRAARLEALAEAQERIISREQMRDLGITRHVIRSQERAKRWRTIGPHVVVLHRGPLSARQRWWVGVLHGGPHAALWGPTAAIAGGLGRDEPPAIHVAVPRGSRRRDLDHELVCVRVHQPRSLSPSDIHPARKPDRVRLCRSVVDGASIAVTVDAARACLAAAVQQRRVPIDELRIEVKGRSRLPHRAELLETLDDIAGGSESLPELQWLRLVRRGGLPLPTRQRRVRRSDGTWYLDAEWEEFALAVEIDGAHHLGLLVREADERRRVELEVGGRHVFRFSSWVVRHDPAWVTDVLRRALIARGWCPA